MKKPGYFKCKHCGKRTLKNVRIKSGQQYCNLPDCQRAGKAARQYKRMHTDSAYREKQKAGVIKWQQARGAAYMQEYRAKHPDYVQKNKEEQAFRNQKRADLPPPEQIVKMDTFLYNNIQPGCDLYLVQPRDLAGVKKIVKMDALILQLNVQEDNISIYKPSQSRL